MKIYVIPELFYIYCKFKIIFEKRNMSTVEQGSGKYDGLGLLYCFRIWKI